MSFQSFPQGTVLLSLSIQIYVVETSAVFGTPGAPSQSILPQGHLAQHGGLPGWICAWTSGGCPLDSSPNRKTRHQTTLSHIPFSLVSLRWGETTFEVLQWRLRRACCSAPHRGEGGQSRDGVCEPVVCTPPLTPVLSSASRLGRRPLQVVR